MKVTLEAARVNAGYTLEEVASRFKISPKTQWNYEKHKTVPNQKYIDKIPEVLGCTYDDINFLPK